VYRSLRLVLPTKTIARSRRSVPLHRSDQSHHSECRLRMVNLPNDQCVVSDRTAQQFHCQHFILAHQGILEIG